MTRDEAIEVLLTFAEDYGEDLEEDVREAIDIVVSDPEQELQEWERSRAYVKRKRAAERGDP